MRKLPRMSYSAERRLEEKSRRREDIVDAAERVFSRSDYSTVTMDQIAREARVSRALVYVYFHDKSDLYFAICVRALRMLHERFEQAIANAGCGYDQVLAIGRSYIDFAGEFPSYFTALSHFEAHKPDSGEMSPTEHEVLEAGKAVHDVTVRAIEAGAKDGSIRSDIPDAMLIALTLWGFIHGIIQVAQTKGAFIEEWGYSSQQLMDNALGMGMLSLRASGGKGGK
jgi:AcrR family transcriptional regulator